MDNPTRVPPWTLNKSRGGFYRRSMLPVNSNYWTKFGEHLVSRGVIQSVDQIPASWRAFDPAAADSQSNCPELHKTIIHVKHLLPAELRARAANLFAGRTISSTDSAFSFKESKRGFLGISSSYSDFLLTYSVGWVSFRERTESAMTSGDSTRVVETILDISRRLGKFVSYYENQYSDAIRVLKLGVPLEGELEEDGRRIASSGEQFVILHEMFHLFHSQKHQATREVQDLVGSEAFAPLRAGLNGQQIEELACDVFAVLVGTGRHQKQGPNIWAILDAVDGAMVALMALDFVEQGGRDATPDEKHPPVLVRLKAVIAAVTILYGTLNAGGPQSLSAANAGAVVFRALTSRLMFIRVVAGSQANSWGASETQLGRRKKMLEQMAGLALDAASLSVLADGQADADYVHL